MFWLLGDYNSSTFNTTGTYAKSLAGLKDIAEGYKQPKNILSQSVLKNKGDQFKIVSRCQSIECDSCDANNLTNCITCWGPFGDPKGSPEGKCMDNPATCNTLTKHPKYDFKKGCYQTRKDCSGCHVCDIGWTRQIVGLTCFNCS